MIDAALIFAFIEVESSGKPSAFLADRNGGSYGWMQIDYQTAVDRGYTGPATGLFDPCTNIEYGCKILEWISTDLIKHGIYSIENLAAAYNSGLQRIIDGGTDTVYSGKIIAAHARWQAALGGRY